MSLALLGERVALVTGGGSGIGRATALRLAADGASIVVNDVAEERAAAVAAEILAAGGTAVASPGTVADEEAAQRLVTVAEEAFGGLDLLVNNAGLTRHAPLHRMTAEEWDEVDGVVLRGAFLVSRASGRLLRGGRRATPRHHRKVVNVSSIAGVHGMAWSANYSAAKAGLIGLTKALAREWASQRINVNAVAPGLVAGTGITAGIPDPLLERLVAAVPLGRLATPADVAGVIAFLCSPDADYITGQVVELHGGLEVIPGMRALFDPL